MKKNVRSSLLFPSHIKEYPVQKHLTLKLMPHLRFSRMPGGGFSAGTGGGDTFEGEYQRKDDERDRLEHKDDRRD